MDPLFVATPSEPEIEESLRMWPELEGKRVRPLLVSAFGDVFVETDVGTVWIASPLEVVCEQVASSVGELERLFSNPEWAQARLLTGVALLAQDQGINREPDQVFAIAPHPAFTGSIAAGKPIPMSLRMWHHLALQMRVQVAQPDESPQS